MSTFLNGHSSGMQRVCASGLTCRQATASQWSERRHSAGTRGR